MENYTSKLDRDVLAFTLAKYIDQEKPETLAQMQELLSDRLDDHAENAPTNRDLDRRISELECWVSDRETHEFEQRDR